MDHTQVWPLKSVEAAGGCQKFLKGRLLPSVASWEVMYYCRLMTRWSPKKRTSWGILRFFSPCFQYTGGRTPGRRSFQTLENRAKACLFAFERTRHYCIKYCLGFLGESPLSIFGFIEVSSISFIYTFCSQWVHMCLWLCPCVSTSLWQSPSVVTPVFFSDSHPHDRLTMKTNMSIFKLRCIGPHGSVVHLKFARPAGDRTVSFWVSLIREIQVRMCVCIIDRLQNYDPI